MTRAPLACGADRRLEDVVGFTAAPGHDAAVDPVPHEFDPPSLNRARSATASGSSDSSSMPIGSPGRPLPVGQVPPAPDDARAGRRGRRTARVSTYDLASRSSSASALRSVFACADRLHRGRLHHAGRDRRGSARRRGRDFDPAAGAVGPEHRVGTADRLSAQDTVRRSTTALHRRRQTPAPDAAPSATSPRTSASTDRNRPGRAAVRRGPGMLDKSGKPRQRAGITRTGW